MGLRYKSSACESEQEREKEDALAKILHQQSVKRPETVSRAVRVKHRIGAWLALAAIALNALWPLIAIAQPKSIPAEICSTAGATIPAGFGTANDFPAQPMHQDRLSACCSYCVSATHGTPLIPAQIGIALDSVPHGVKFVAVERLDWISASYLPALSRGPPLFS
jgi:hypothetical protein